MQKNKFLSMLGFAKKANYLVAGDSNVKDALIIKKELFFLIIASDISDNRKSYWKNLAQSFNVPVKIGFEKLEMGIAIGMSPRSVIGITNKKMGKNLEMLLYKEE